MFKEMIVTLVNRVVAPKRIIGKNGGPRRRRGTTTTTKNLTHNFQSFQSFQL
jgi:hypothetical protein